MAEATEDFFETLARRGHEPLLEKASGRIRFELAHDKKTKRWLVEVDNGDVSVSHKNGHSDCTVRTSETLFDQVVRGEENATAAALRGAVTVEGDPELLILFQRVFPGPPPTGKTSAGGRRSR
jgi:putative sterol carrier protein